MKKRKAIETTPAHNSKYVFLVMALVCAACSPVDESSVYGLYRSNTVEAETLEIAKDGTYVHRYKLDSVEATNRSSWRFYQNGDDIRIVFQGFKFTPSARGKIDGEWPAIVERCGFSICIPIEIGTGYRFEKASD